MTVDLAARAASQGVERRAIPFDGVELRAKADGAGGETLTFTGYACVVDAPYEMEDFLGTYTEVVRAGAFTRTLKNGADVPFKINHEGMTLARTKSGTLRLAEDDHGLHVDADLDPTNPQVVALRSAMERGDMDEMSFAFRVNTQVWSPDWTQRDITEVNIHKGDVSVVNYGANPHTAGASLRHMRNAGALRAKVPALLAQVRAGELSAATLETLQQVLSLIASADEAVDEAQPILADLLGVPNPDADDEMKSGDLSLFMARARALDLRR